MSPKQAPADSKDEKEKPSRNLEMEGQHVRTITPSRKNRNASARQLRGASKAEAKGSYSQKIVLTNAQPKRRQDKIETEVLTNSELPVKHWKSRERNPSKESKKTKSPGQNKKVVKAKLKQQGQGKESSPKEGRIHNQDRSTSNPSLNKRQRKKPRRGTTEG